MKSNKSVAGTALVAVAAALFISGTSVTSAQNSTPSVVKAKCFGGNACKGQSECKTTTNGCKGQNACKGEGFTLHNACERPGRA